MEDESQEDYERQGSRLAPAQRARTQRDAIRRTVYNQSETERERLSAAFTSAGLPSSPGGIGFEQLDFEVQIELVVAGHAQCPLAVPPLSCWRVLREWLVGMTVRGQQLLYGQHRSKPAQK